MIFFEEKTDKELAAAWATLSNVTEDRAFLEASQHHWKAYADAQCALEALPARSYSSPERYSFIFKSICHSRLKILRIQELQHQGTGCDACIR